MCRRSRVRSITKLRASTVVLALALAAASRTAAAQPAEPPLPPPDVSAAPAAAPAPDAARPADLLAQADAAVDRGNLTEAQALYDRVLREFPATAEGRDASRALRILVARQRTGTLTPAPLPEDVVIRPEPFSLRTSERLRLTTWEKLDFGVTSFLYGLSVGLSYGLSVDDGDGSTGTSAMAAGAITYTLGSVAYLSLANPSRGDLPLALGIASYLPTTTLLVANAAIDDPDPENVGLATAGAGLLAVPIAVAATSWLDLDPGDTQLVRDAGFWGLVLATSGTLGFAGTTEDFGGFQSYREPSSRAIGIGGLAGLYGGLALGALAASQSEISLERVRVSTWGGYGGALLGGLLMVGGDLERDVWRGICVGGLLGVVTTFAFTGRLDGIPADTQVISQAKPSFLRSLIPTLTTVDTAAGGQRPALGLAGPLL
jgi:hypothetical protein